MNNDLKVILIIIFGTIFIGTGIFILVKYILDSKRKKKEEMRRIELEILDSFFDSFDPSLGDIPKMYRRYMGEYKNDIKKAITENPEKIDKLNDIVSKEKNQEDLMKLYEK